MAHSQFTGIFLLFDETHDERSIILLCLLCLNVTRWLLRRCAPSHTTHWLAGLQISIHVSFQQWKRHTSRVFIILRPSSAYWCIQAHIDQSYSKLWVFNDRLSKWPSIMTQWFRVSINVMRGCSKKKKKTQYNSSVCILIADGPIMQPKQPNLQWAHDKRTSNLFKQILFLTCPPFLAVTAKLTTGVALPFACHIWLTALIHFGEWTLLGLQTGNTNGCTSLPSNEHNRQGLQHLFSSYLRVMACGMKGKGWSRGSPGDLAVSIDFQSVLLIKGADTEWGKINTAIDWV